MVDLKDCICLHCGKKKETLMMTENQARTKGKKLLKKMKGKGWKLHVYENIDWHYNVWNGPIAVYENNGECWCLMGTEPDCKGVGMGHMAWSDNFHSKDPNVVVRHQVRLARKVADGYDTAVKRIEAVLAP